MSKTLLMTSSALAVAVAVARAAAAQEAPLATAGPMTLALAQTAPAAEPSPAPAPAAPAAPAPAAASGALDTVVVTASRISVTGYTQPTPVTVVTAQVLQRDAKPSIGDVIRQLPANMGGASPFTQGSGVIAAGTAGLDTVNLRGLGTSRTLVLFDGQRVMQAVVTGQVDIGLLPSILVDRIDVVTAGASAAWGSDAVAGVVNLVLNKKFDGLRANFDYGNTYASDQQTYRVQAAGGRDFAGGRGHMIVAGAFTDAPDIVFAGQRSSWDHYRQLLPNPAYTPANNQPKYIHVDNVGLSQATTGGLITGGPLKGIQLVGPNATPTPFNYGITSGAVTGAGSEETFNASLDNLSVAFRTLTFFGYSSYELTDDIKASVQFNYGTTHSENSSVPNTAFGNLTIPIDNAYLPASVKSLMTTAKVTSIPFGSTFLNNLQPTDHYSLNAFENTIGVPVGAIDRDLLRMVFTLDGAVKDGWYGQNWKWNVYYQLGRSHMYQTTLNNDIKANLSSAIDAVFAPAGNALGVPAGTIVCRSSLTNPANGCVPLNIFGTGTASQAAIRYVNVKPGQNFQNQHFQQDVEAGSAQGELPFGLPAGSIGAALGIEHRSEAGSTNVDPGAQAVQYALGNFSAFSGKYDVTEGFVEAEVPLLKDMVVKSMGLNLAGRVTSYSTSGTVETWKVGLTSQLDGNVRVRGTISRDIRAPNLSELFSTGVPSTNSAVDPHTGQNVFIYTNAGGNPNLKPEIGDTYSGGVVLTPSFIPRLSLSTDYYSIDLTNAIVSVGASTVLANCNAGQTVFCSQLVFGGVNGALSQINTYPVNVASYKTSGLDFQADYSHSLFRGDLSFRLLGNYTLNQSQVQFGTTVNYAGAIGADSPVAGFPRFRSTVSATYTQGSASITAQGRMIGSAQLVSTWTSKDVDSNTIPAINYLDFRASYELNKHLQMFATMDNALNQAPPNVAGTPGRGSGVYYSTSTRSDIYDVIGRTYRIGVRARF